MLAVSRQAFGTIHCHWYQMTDRKKAQYDCNIYEEFCIKLYKSIKQCSVVFMIILLMQHSFQLQIKSPTPLFPLALLTLRHVKKPSRARRITHKFKTHQGIDPCRAGGERTSVSSQLVLPAGREDSHHSRRAWHTCRRRRHRTCVRRRHALYS